MAWDASSASTLAWASLSAYTLADVQGDIDFQLVADEQFPLIALEDRPLVITESGFTTP